MSTSRRQLREQVEFMVAAVKLVVIDLPLNLAEQLPAMADLVNHTKLHDWDFFPTVAGVGAGVLEFPGEKSRVEGDALTGLVMNSLNDWDTQAAGALADLMKFVRESVENGIPTEMAIGVVALERGFCTSGLILRMGCCRTSGELFSGRNAECKGASIWPATPEDDKHLLLAKTEWSRRAHRPVRSCGRSARLAAERRASPAIEIERLILVHSERCDDPGI